VLHPRQEDYHSLRLLDPPFSQASVHTVHRSERLGEARPHKIGSDAWFSFLYPFINASISQASKARILYVIG